MDPCMPFSRFWNFDLCFPFSDKWRGSNSFPQASALCKEESVKTTYINVYTRSRIVILDKSERNPYTNVMATTYGVMT